MKITYEMTRHWLGDDDIYEILTDIANGDYKPKVLKSDILSTADDLSFMEEPKLPDGLQKYIDGVGLNILYSNYHKSTNGIWSRAEVEFEHEDEQCNPYYEVNIDFGCQDDTRNEQYSQTMYFFKKGDEWTCTDDYCEPCSCRGWIESNDEEGRDAIQRCDECKVFDTDEYAHKIYDQECKDYFNKEKV